MFRIRSRIVNFRVTDEEFERLKTASALQGARCLSDFARSVILGSVHGSPPQAAVEPLDEKMVSLERRLATVESYLVQLRDVVETSRPEPVGSAK